MALAGRVQVERFNEPNLQRQRLLLIGRLQRLQRLGLADETQPGTWAIHVDAEKTLRALAERGRQYDAQRLGQQIAATVRGDGVSWEIGRQRSPSV